jgi:hypothetical protein
VQTTGSHRFAVVGRGFRPARTLRRGDHLVSRSGSCELIEYKVVNDKPLAVYNLEVSGAHTYFVGTDELWVHNLKPDQPPPPPEPNE